MKSIGAELLLDTNAMSAIIGNQPGAERAADDYADWIIPIIAYGEYLHGVLGSTKQAENLRGLHRLSDACTFVSPNFETSEIYAEIAHELKVKGRPIPTNDIWIAALARQHGFPIMTRDTHFSHIDAVNTIGW